MQNKKIRGWIYHIFPCTINIRTYEVDAIDDHIIWLLFGWLFYVLQFTFAFIFSFTEMEPLFPIKLSQRDLAKLSKIERSNFENNTYGL